MRWSPFVCLPLLFCAAPAFAQREPPVSPPAPVEPPPAPNVDDPMLAPIARPRVEIGTWEDALKHVRARSTEIRIAAQDVARAEAQSRIALAGTLTQINGTGAYTHNLITNDSLQFARGPNDTIVPRPVQVPFPNFGTGQISLVQPVIAPRQWYAIGTAHRNEDAAKLTYEDMKRQIALGVANAIVAVVTAERIAELNRLGLRNALARLEITMRRTGLGGGTGLDVVRARQDVEIARATLVAGDESLRQSRESLGLALGLPEQIGVPPNVDLNGLEADARNVCKAVRTVEERPDVAALHQRAEVGRRLETDAKLQFSPTVDFRSGVSTTTVDTGAAPNTTWNIQAVLTVPIWDGGVRYGNMRDAAAQHEQAIQRLEAQRRKATIEVVQAQRQVTVATDRRRVAASARDLAAETDRLTRTSYIEGRGTSLELITAAQQLRESEIQLALRDFELVRARVLAVIALASCPW